MRGFSRLNKLLVDENTPVLDLYEDRSEAALPQVTLGTSRRQWPIGMSSPFSASENVREHWSGHGEKNSQTALAGLRK